MNMPFLSVIIPLYNCQAYICDCIESVLSQSFTDYEIIIVNDGSTDRSRTFAQQYLYDSRIRLIDQENRGLLHARAAREILHVLGRR